jgi:hypothetical protein
VGNTLTSDVEVRLQDDEEEHEQQEVDDGVDEHGREAGLHVHEVDGAVPAGHLQHAARAQEREQRRGDDRRRPVPHRGGCAGTAPPAVLCAQRASSSQAQEREKRTSGRQRQAVTVPGARMLKTRTVLQTVSSAEGKHGIGHRVH